MEMTDIQVQEFIDLINAEAGEGDRAAEYVFADWLYEQGDPRGEGWMWLLNNWKRPAVDGRKLFWYVGRYNTVLMQCQLPAGLYIRIAPAFVNSEELFFTVMLEAADAVVRWQRAEDAKARAIASRMDRTRPIRP